MHRRGVETMKKVFAILLSLVLLVTAMAPITAFAEGDKDLEKVIKIVREKVDIPKELSQFTYDINSNGNTKVWYLNWNSKDNAAGSMSVGINDAGKILQYNYYKPYQYNSQRKLPKVSRQDALTKAEAFIKRMDPQLPAQLKQNEVNQPYPMDYSYSFSYTRMVDGIPFPANYIQVNVNNETGIVENYYTNWTDDLTFPDADKALSLEQAQKAFKEKLGLRLVYNQAYDGEKRKIFLSYAPKYSNSYVDALSGEKVDMRDHYGPYYDRYGYSGGIMANMSMKAADSREQAALTPEEMKAVEEVSKLLSKEDMEKKLRDTKVFELTSDYKVRYASLNRDWFNNDEYAWSFDFFVESKEKPSESRSVNVRANAKSGEIISFYTYFPGTAEQDTVKYDKDTARKAVEDFLKQIQPEKYSRTEFDDTYVEEYSALDKNGKQREFYFRYIRKEGAAYVAANMLSARYDAINGRIVNYEMNWYNTFSPVVSSKVLPVEGMYTKLFGEIGLELQYRMEYPRDYYEKFGMTGVEDAPKPAVKLVYAVKPDKPALFDAVTGSILNPNNGELFQEAKTVEYTDIKGSSAEKQIKVLAEFGIALPGTTFKPKTNITQKEFLYLVSKTMANVYYGPVSTLPEKEKDIDQMYNTLIREGVVKEGEKAPAAAVTREEAVKFLIRAMKYEKVADIEGIFLCTFKDKSKITPKLIGYVAIAQGLKIVGGDTKGNFNPTVKLTREQAAVILYNYMQN
jgi:hypothetical protein